jgi:streptogramin lyase
VLGQIVGVMADDHFTNTLILVGSNHITQIDPKTFTVVSDWTAPSKYPAIELDQAAVDGRGHLWATSHDGNLVFIDYSRTRKVANPANSVSFHFIEPRLDDIALLCRS